MIFDDAISSLKFYEETPVKLFPTYYDLQLLDKKIPIVSYVKVRRNYTSGRYAIYNYYSKS